jgi:cysteine desulfurase / selenocysteine lyase
LLKSQVLELDRIREDFPILKRKVKGKRLVYLDNAATTQKPKRVIDALVDYYERYNANAHRSVHTLGIEATAEFERSRREAADFIHAATPQEIVFTRGTTESINLVRFAWAEKFVEKGDTIVLTLMEHHSNIVPWQLVAKRNGAKLKFIGMDAHGVLKMDEMEEAIEHSPRIVSLTQCSNVLGTINDVTRICRRARKAGALTVVDGAQSVPHMPVNVGEIGCDFLAYSGHKMLGPTGIGVLYGRKALLEEMEPFQGGGEMIREVHLESSKWNEVPYKFEAGTANIADAIGLCAAIEYLTEIGMEKVRRHEVELLKYSNETLGETDGLEIYGPEKVERRGGIISFNLADVHPHDLATILDGEGIAIRSGHHCAQPLMEWLGVSATSRASLYIYNSYDDIDALKVGLEKARRIFKV